MLGLLSTAVISIGASSCNNNNDPYTKSDAAVERDTIYDTVNVDKHVLGVTLHNVCNTTGEYHLDFNPHADWKWTPNGKGADWFTVNSATGKATDTKLTFTVGENMSIKERSVETTITMDGKEYPLTIKQNASAPFAMILDSTIVLKPDYKAAYVNDIVCNSTLTVGSFPDWIESVEVTRDDKEYVGFHRALVTLKNGSMDDAVRVGEIVFKAEGAEDLKYTIKCQEFTAKFEIVDTNGISNEPIIASSDKQFPVEILSNPSAPEYGIKIYEAVPGYIPGSPDSYKELDAAEIEFAMATTRAAYVSNMLNVTVKARTEGVNKKYTIFIVNAARIGSVNQYNIDRMAEPQRLSFHVNPSI